MTEVSSELPSPKLPGRFEKAVGDTISMFMNPQDSTRAIDFFFNQLLVNTQIRFNLFAGLLDLSPPSKLDISPYLDSPLETPRKGELFDRSRETMNIIVSRLFSYPPNQTAAETERMMKFGRSIYAFVIRKLVGKSLSETDLEFKKSLKGISWSIMAKDIDKTLGPKGQKPLSSQWKDRMRRIILADKPGMNEVVAELKKFESGDEEIFSKRSDQ